MNNLVTIHLFGELGNYIGATEWQLNVKSVKDAIAGINTITKNKFNEFFIKNKKLQAKYRILINGEDFISPYQELNETNWESVNQSELVMKKHNLKTIDIVPVIESSGAKTLGIFTTILAVIIIIIGIILIETPIGIPLIMAGLALLGAGVVALLSRPPTFHYKNPEDANSQSNLFSGPQNTAGEGNPVPIGYGTMLVGSNVISAGYKITEFKNN